MPRFNHIPWEGYRLPIGRALRLKKFFRSSSRWVALVIMEKYAVKPGAAPRESVFPYVSNQEMNRSLKLIGEICDIKCNLTFHSARHTFATTVTLLNGVPLETISKMLGHTKITTTMIYSRVTQNKIGIDMELLQSRLDKNWGGSPGLKVVV